MQLKEKSFLGICGRRRSGKDTLARILSLHIDSLRVLHFASALKGIALLDLNEGAAFLPFLSDSGRKVLQDLGVGMYGFHPSGMLVWVELALAVGHYVPEKHIVIADVRMLHEEAALRRVGGKIVKVLAPPTSDGEIDQHKSEVEVDEINADFHITKDALFAAIGEGRVLQDVVIPIARMMGWEASILNPPRLPKVYISSNILHNPDFVSFFRQVKEQLAAAGFAPIVPVLTKDGKQKDYDFFLDCVRSVGWVDACRKLVASDIRGVGEADAVLCILQKPSVGVAMEMLLGAMMGKPVVVVTPDLKLLFHPWLWAISQGKVFHTLDMAIRWLRSFFGLVA